MEYHTDNVDNEDTEYNIVLNEWVVDMEIGNHINVKIETTYIIFVLYSSSNRIFSDRKKHIFTKLLSLK